MISIIIPVYKVEDFIGSCLNSVCQQTYSEIEVILVDDCSPDRSMAVAEPFICELKKKFPVKVIRHEKNKGLSAARNTGVMNSLGDYLFFWIVMMSYLKMQCFHLWHVCKNLVM
ncbi:glycosyltransferase family 2 protein [Bacteroides faecichinchillae]|uniref:glycosyltransferase family 2 protein n=1 Tax=Bacteroides faecichinchillae TaxID=871325 RepID=UPI003571164C